MKKTIFWDFKEKPLNAAHLNDARINIARQDQDTSLSLVNVDANDLQLIINALNTHHGIGKEMREVKIALGKLYSGQRLIFDKMEIGKKETDKVGA